jgi:Type I restriction enzyme R protein N terminus (HSDR_N)
MALKHNSFWDTELTFEFANEADVETRLIWPLLEALHWPKDEIHPKVPVDFKQGRKKGRKPEADFALAEAGSQPVKTAWVVIEAKPPNDPLEGVDDQARSYAYMLRAPFFLCTNGVELEVWQTGWFSENARVFTAKVAELISRRGELEALLAKEAVMAHLNSYGLPQVTLANQDISAYLRSVLEYTENMSIANRRLHRDDKSEIEFSSRQDGLSLLKDGTRLDIAAWGGRGKSSLLDGFVLRCLRDSTPRIPIRVPLENVTGTLYEYLHLLLRPTIPTLGTPHAVSVWLRQVKTALLLDNWDQLDEQKQRSLENDLLDLQGAPCAVVITRRPHVLGPKGNFKAFRLEPLIDAELRAIVTARVNAAQNPDYFVMRVMKQIPQSIRVLLREPIFLDVYLTLLELSPHQEWSGLGTLDSPLSLLEKCLSSALAARNSQIERALIETRVVCTQLSSNAKGFSLSSITTLLTENGIDKSSTEFALQMEACGLWSSRSDGSYVFAHEVWREYFASTQRIERSKNDNGQAILDWITNSSLGDLRLGLPLIAVPLAALPVAEQAFDAILEQDFELYLSTLSVFISTTAKTTDSTLGPAAYFAEWRQSYLAVINAKFPKFKLLFDPWVQSASPKEEHRKFVIVTLARDTSLTHMLGFGEDNDPNVVEIELPPETDLHETRFAPDNSSTIHSPFNSIGLRPGLGKYHSAKSVVTRIKEINDKGQLPAIGWIARERLVNWAVQALRSHSLDPSRWRELRVADLLSWIKKVDIIPEEIREALNFDENAKANNRFYTSGSRPWVLLSELGDLAEELISTGFGNILLPVLMLPGPDLAVASSPWMSSMYSRERKIERVQVLFDAAISTYRELCELYFSAINTSFFYSQGPVRAVVVIYPSADGTNDLVHYYWQPTSSWTATAQVSWESSRPEGVYERLNDLRDQYIRMERKPRQVSSHSGWINWGIQDAAVTKIVTELIEEDLKGLLPDATF